MQEGIHGKGHIVCDHCGFDIGSPLRNVIWYAYEERFYSPAGTETHDIYHYCSPDCRSQAIRARQLTAKKENAKQ